MALLEHRRPKMCAKILCFYFRAVSNWEYSSSLMRPTDINGWPSRNRGGWRALIRSNPKYLTCLLNIKETHVEITCPEIMLWFFCLFVCLLCQMAIGFLQSIKQWFYTTAGLILVPYRWVFGLTNTSCFLDSKSHNATGAFLYVSFVCLKQEAYNLCAVVLSQEQKHVVFRVFDQLIFYLYSCKIVLFSRFMSLNSF